MREDLPDNDKNREDDFGLPVSFFGMLSRRLLTALVLPCLLSSFACGENAPSAATGGAATGGVGTGGTGAGTGGAAGGTGGGATGGATGGSPSLPLPPNDDETAPPRDGFTLLWEDHFDAIDPTRWQTGTHTFTENAAQFTPGNVSVESGYLKLSLTALDPPSAEGRSLAGGELRTLAAFSYGRFETRARFARGSGVVSSLFTYYDHWADPNLPENWNEIDVEFLGKDNAGVQFNVIHWNAQSQRTTHEQHHTTGFDPSAEFHDYAIEWVPDAVRFYVDDVLVHTQTEAIAEFLTLDQRLMMNIWAVMDTPNLNSWAGKFETSSLPTAAYYDWVRVYTYDAP